MKIFLGALPSILMLASTAVAQSPDSAERYLSCVGVEESFVVVLTGTSGPASVYQNKELWHRFRSFSQTEQSISSTELVGREGFEKRFRAFELDRLTGKGKIVDWEVKRKMGLLGGSKDKTKIKKKAVGDCEIVQSPKVERRF